MQDFPLEALEKLEKRPRLHFIGIGGVHMSAIAELLFRRGFPTSGNDRDESDNVRHLREVGVNVMIGHKAEYVENADIVVRNAAIHDSSPDIVRARELGLPIYERQEVLGALMRGAKKRICTLYATHYRIVPIALQGGKLKKLQKNNRPPFQRRAVIPLFVDTGYSSADSIPPSSSSSSSSVDSIGSASSVDSTGMSSSAESIGSSSL